MYNSNEELTIYNTYLMTQPFLASYLHSIDFRILDVLYVPFFQQGQ